MNTEEVTSLQDDFAILVKACNVIFMTYIEQKDTFEATSVIRIVIYLLLNQYLNMQYLSANFDYEDVEKDLDETFFKLKKRILDDFKELKIGLKKNEH